MANPITTYGLTPVPASPSTLLTTSPSPTQHPTALPITALPIPLTPLATRINTYALSNLTPQTYNHSRRVYHYGIAIKFHRFPEWEFSDETYFCACMLHDIGATERNLTSTRLSFEFAGGDFGVEGREIAPQAQAESIVEAIMRHQDLCEKGKISALGQLLQLATILDNTGAHESLINPSTIGDITKHFPRMKWSSCFAATIQREISLKPWAHSTVLGEEEFPRKILGSTLMVSYE
ncbi:putative urea hydro-lyase/cyanamide hydratase [Aspergillus ruber CBS 135680]|uniref:Cyanamide hydratase n=1 Tax=Aspergillus ruber (strain CBS 135680) TaxID=1388766 RepID=A0A017SEA2_ASPRC|nr:cyanamide hydratase [Aspergillus ruber CBS 135680]EYE95297.1 cyanamide hydratase [Aspergillus ruber CBS 135680]